MSAKVGLVRVRIPVSQAHQYCLFLIRSHRVLKVVAHALPSALAARAANPAMPLVIVTTPGLLTNGFAKTVDHPGANATGTDELAPGVTARRLELLKMAAPAVSRVALLSTTPGGGSHELQLADAEEAASVSLLF